MKYGIVNKFVGFVILLSVMILTGCSQPDIEGGTTGTDSGEVVLNMTLHTPSVTLPAAKMTRAVNEMLVNRLDLLVLEDDAGDGQYKYKYSVKALNLSYDQNKTYSYKARLIKSSKPTKLYFLANYPDVVNNLTENATEQAIKEAMTFSFTANGISESIPMSEIIEIAGGLTQDRNIYGSLVRSLARVDVLNNTTSAFSLESIQFYRVNSKGQVIPDNITNHKVSAPSIPEQSSQNVKTTKSIILNNYTQAEHYLPESEKVSESNQLLGATCVVVGGTFEGDPTTTYYRMDFTPDGTSGSFGQILRNHKYVFNITEVSGSGWPTPDEAAENLSSNLEAEIKEWNEESMESVFDGSNFFGVTTRNLYLNYWSDDEHVINVDTDVDSYTLHWLDDNGNIDGSAPSFTLGESSMDPNEYFKVTVSGDGTSIDVVTLKENYADSPVSVYLLVKAARLQIKIGLHQKGRTLVNNKHIKVYNNNRELGKLGDEIFGSLTPNPSRPAAMVNIMKNRSLFGPGGTVDFLGYEIGGINYESYAIPPKTIEMFDVLYLTYAGNPTASNCDEILEWLNADQRRVLFVMCDGSASNTNMISKLGMTRLSQYSSVQPYVFYDNDNPFRNGKFGEISRNVKIRCYDTTHGELDYNVAVAAGVTPVMQGGHGGMVLGVDIQRRIIYCGDIDIFFADQGALGGIYPSVNNPSGQILNDADRLLANIWAWVAEVVLAEESN